jgi:PAS domain S-box-containing protein
LEEARIRDSDTAIASADCDSPGNVNALNRDLTAQLAQVVHCLPAAVVSVGMDRRIECWNPGAEKLFGFESERAVGEDVMLFVPLSRRTEAAANFERALGGESFSAETVRQHQSGQLIEVSMSLAPLRGEDGEVAGACAVMQDITRRKATERALRQEAETHGHIGEALRASERDFRSFFEMMGVGNVIADARSGRFLRVNRHFCEITGYSEVELYRMNASMLTVPEDEERDRAGWAEARWKKESFTIEKRYRRKDGATVWVQVTSSLIHDQHGEPLHAIGVVRDITEQRRLSEELQKARFELEKRVEERTHELTEAHRQAREMARHFETLIANSPLPIATLDTEGRVTIWNAAAEQLYGWGREEVIGKPPPILPAADAPRYEEEMRRIAQATDRLIIDTKRQKRDGTVLDVCIWRAPLFNEGGKLTGSLAILMDMTERKLLERGLIESTDRESRRIGQELHDTLCQHLLGAAFAAKALSNGLRPNSAVAAQAGELARMVNSAVAQTREIVRGLNPVELDGAGLMVALEELVRRPRSGPNCRLEYVEPVCVPDAAAVNIYRIAEEAVTNAVRHSAGTEVVVRLSDEGGIRLQVRDNGKGFDQKRASEQGLGLATMKYRAHALGGQLWIDTSGRGGTSVTCVLPHHR